MISPFEVWKRTLWRWAAPLAFCVVNLIVLAVYFQFYAGRVDRLSDQLDETQNRLQSYQQEHAQSQAFLGSLQDQEQQVDVLYVDHFQTEQQRFTSAIREVKRLAREAGLQPASPRVEPGHGGPDQRVCRGPPRLAHALSLDAP